MTNLYQDEQSQEPVAIPHGELSTDALRGVIESFVLREGTDYGNQHFSLDQKVQHVLQQLERNEAQIMFDPNSETIDIIVTMRFKSSELREVDAK